MPLCDHTGRLMYDTCATKQYLRDNKEIHDYMLLNHRIDAPKACQGTDFSMWRGYGLDSEMVPYETTMRSGIITNEKERGQVSVRTFQAAPNLRRGELSPDTESRLIQGGVITTDSRYCRDSTDNAVEVDFDRFDPCLLHNPVDTVNIIPQWTRGGANSRAIALSEPFQRQMRSLRERQWSKKAPVYVARDAAAPSSASAQTQYDVSGSIRSDNNNKNRTQTQKKSYTKLKKIVDI